MPVKIRCNGCQKVLNVPDRARGKAIKCPNCQTVLKIPAATAAAKAAAGADRPPAAPAVERDDFLAGMDLRRAEDTRVRVCIKCGAEVDEEVVDCPECGHNVDTGVMSDYMRKKRERKGPDPEEYWGMAWTGSFKFLKENIPLVFRTAMYWVLFIFLFVFSFYGLALTGAGKLPNIIFWLSVATVMLFGACGWFWHCSVEVIRHSMGPKRNKKMPHIHFDFFQCLALGLKFIIWPRVLFLPAILVFGFCIGIPMAIAGSFDMNYAVSAAFDLLLLVLWLLVFPLAMVHMSMPYTYKAWTPYHMGISLGKNILPALYWFVQLLAATLPFLATALILHLTWEGGLAQLFADIFQMTLDLVDWVLGWFMDASTVRVPVGKRAWYLVILVLALTTIPIIVFVTPFCIAGAFGAVFLMRANGYVGLYFRDKLDLVKEQQPNTLCGFWPRYLAYLVDWLVINIAVGLVAAVAYGLIWLVKWAELDYLAYLVNFLYLAFAIGFPWLYFAKPESNPAYQGSIGKQALGIKVVEDSPEFETLEFGKASGRYWVKIVLGTVTLGISWLIAAFTERKTALHDNIMKTIVVWEGDDERNAIG